MLIVDGRLISNIACNKSRCLQKRNFLFILFLQFMVAMHTCIQCECQLNQTGHRYSKIATNLTLIELPMLNFQKENNNSQSVSIAFSRKISSVYLLQEQNWHTTFHVYIHPRAKLLVTS